MIRKIFQKQKLPESLTLKVSTFFTILKNRDTISTACEAGVLQSRICLKDGKFPVLEKALIKWMQLICFMNVPIDGDFLKEKAKTIAEKIIIDVDFKASDSWNEFKSSMKFKSRHNLVFKKKKSMEKVLQ